MTPRPIFRTALLCSAALTLTACDGPFDFDLRGASGGFTTANAAQIANTPRPSPDANGILSYPSYQVAIARRGDTVNDIAARIGANAAELGEYNGIAADVPLREGEVIALPSRVTSAGPAQVAAPAQVDVTTLAGNAIERAEDTSPPSEPTRHKVQQGETAYIIARRYDVPVRTLARWNGLGRDYAIREGQYLLIPDGSTPPPIEAAPTAPGQGSPTPKPPSSTKPLPKEDPVAPRAKSDKPVVDLGKQTKPTATGRFARPVNGTVIREYRKGRNDGIDIKAAPGAAVKAADAGTVAAITESAEGVPIVVVRHKGNLLTVYANVTDVGVKKGDPVRRGQAIAKLRGGNDSFVHFEVRDGFDSVDPNDYLDG